MTNSDCVCLEKGIPNHLHQLAREADQEFSPEELLYRRFSFSEESLVAAIQFKKMSVNREKYGHGPDDVLWNSEDGGRHEGCGVARIPVSAFDQILPHPTVDSVLFRMEPRHDPLRCNYPHTEVVVFKLEDGNWEPQEDLKPPSVKLRFRENLGEYLRIVLPNERAGGRFELKK